MASLHFNLIDYIILAILVLSMIVGLIRGFVKEVIALIIWAVAFIVAFRFSDAVSHLMIHLIHSFHARLVISFLLLLIGVLLLGAGINYLLSKLIQKSSLSVANRLLGLVFGLMRAIVIMVGLILFLQLTRVTHWDAWHQSQLLPYANPLVESADKIAPADIADYFRVTIYKNNKRGD
jgi:membrane protein required for colicin V production